MDRKQAVLLYESGVACAAAKKTLPATKYRNLEGTSAHLLCCIYYYASNSEACNILGHRDCRSTACQIKPKSKEERMVVSNALEREAITAAVERLSIKRKLYCIVFEIY